MVETIIAIFSFVAVVVGGLIVAVPTIMNYKGWLSISKQQSQYQQSFDKIIDQLSSDKITAQLSAAVLLRRFFKVEFNYHIFNKNSKSKETDPYFLRKETINVISSLLKTLPTSVYQKTLADGLASCENLTEADLQNANLQNAYIGSKSYRINLAHSDFYCANLSKALITRIDGQECYFKDSILCGTRFKDCNFTKASFQGADLTNVYFKDVTLLDADFSDAYNIPQIIAANLENGIYKGTDKVTTLEVIAPNRIFFSMSGSLSNEEAHITKVYKEYLEKRGYQVESYERDHYPHFGQLTAVKAKIEKCTGMVVFGSKQILIKEGVFRPNLSEETIWQNEWLSTSWNEIEVGMGVMLGIPILLVSNDELKTGIFDNCISEILLDKTSLKPDYKDLRNFEIDESFISWLSKLPSITQ